MSNPRQPIAWRFADTDSTRIRVVTDAPTADPVNYCTECGDPITPASTRACCRATIAASVAEYTAIDRAIAERAARDTARQTARAAA